MPEETSLLKILSAIERRIDQREASPYWMEYSLEQFVSAELQNSMNKRLKQESKMFLKDEHFVGKGQFARKGAKVKMSDSSPIFVKGILTRPRADTVTVFDGKALKEYIPGSHAYSVSVSGKRIPIARAWHVCGEVKLLELLRDWRDNKGKEALGKVANISIRSGQSAAGHRLSVIELKYASGWATRVRLREDIEYCVGGLENIDPSQEIAWRCHDCAYQVKDGIAYLEAAVNTIFIPKKKSAISRETRFRLSSLETDADRIPDELFEFPPPSGAMVYDKDAKVPLPGADSAKIDEIISGLGVNSKSRFGWAVVTTLLLTACVVVFFLRRRVLKHRRGDQSRR